MKKTILLSAMAIFLAGCSSSVPMKGYSNTGIMRFNGTTATRGDGSGTLTAVRNDGVKCSGHFIHSPTRDGRGHYEGTGLFACDDGRSGPIEFIGIGENGTGTGKLGDDEFTFAFGPKVK
jgi:hypothetical protein